jgi:peptidyl-Lys metalloendopeptidase
MEYKIRKAITATLVLGMNAAWAAPGVEVSVTPERQSLGKNEDVMVTVTVTNTTAETQYLLAWQTPFALSSSGAPTAPLFEVTRDGLAVSYVGRQVKRAAPTAADYIALAPGSSRSASVDLGALYDLSASGAYSVRWRGGAPLYSRPGVPRAKAAAEAAQGAVMRVEGRPARRQAALQAPPGGAGLTYRSCSAAQQGQIAQASQAALAMSLDADAYLHKKTRGPRYTQWFGAYEPARWTTMMGHFAAIKDAFATKPVTVDCSCDEPYYAYVYPNQPYEIYVCQAFWAAPLTGTDSKGGTLVHEMSHFTVVAGTDDWAYGQSAAAALAVSNPARAIENADSHEYFGENTPHLE